MMGLAPLTYTTVRDWAYLTKAWPQPYEVEALMRLDATLLHQSAPAKSVNEKAKEIVAKGRHARG